MEAKTERITLEITTFTGNLDEVENLAVQYTEWGYGVHENAIEFRDRNWTLSILKKVEPNSFDKKIIHKLIHNKLY